MSNDSCFECENCELRHYPTELGAYCTEHREPIRFPELGDCSDFNYGEPTHVEVK